MSNNFNENVKLNNNDISFTMIKIIILLITLQISRIIIKQIMFLFLPKNNLNDILISICIMLFFIFFIIWKAKKEETHLDVFSYMMSNETKIYYILVTVCILILIFISPSFISKLSFESLVSLLYTIIIIPIYKEILFRSYIWSILIKEHEDQRKVYFITSVLFSLYHIGYIDTIIMTSGFNKMALIIFAKCSLMLSYGIFIGFFRYKIKNSYSCMLVHGFLNIIGRL
ncbi:CPBP family glutamic-type intramembrane protease [Terrisporobacter sp.]